ncbi:MAG: AAA family ATPase [Desulfobacterales bacterium]|nr:AAA family ATPase [Desulfobacterales bacterium]
MSNLTKGIEICASKDNSSIEASYQNYYMRVIEKHAETDNFVGLKLVVGPTGMGKTSAIPNVIKKMRDLKIDKPCIYTSHRHLLIEEMAKELSDKEIPYVYLKRDEELIRAFVKKKGKGEFLIRLDELQFFKPSDKTLKEIWQIINKIEEYMASEEKFPKEKFKTVYKGLQEQIKSQCSKRLSVIIFVNMNPLSATLTFFCVFLP